MRKLIIAACFVGVLIVSPAYLWLQLAMDDSTLPHWQYDDADLRAAIEGTWQLDYGGRTITLLVKQATRPVAARAPKAARTLGAHAALTLVPSAAACNHDRTFVRDAAACLDTTAMPLRIAISTGGVAEGSFTVHGERFRGGWLRFRFDGIALEAEILPDGQVNRASVLSGTPELRERGAHSRQDFAKLVRISSVTDH